MLNNSERPFVAKTFVRESASTFVRSTFLALTMALLLVGEHSFGVQAREDILAVKRIRMEEGRLDYAYLARGFHPGADRKSRRRRRSRRRRLRRRHYRATGGATGSSQSGRVPVGSWGGEHIALQVTEGGARLELDCASGNVEGPLSLDAGGRFNNQGVYVRGHGGPVRREQQPDSHPARFTGWTDGKRMTLTIKLTDTGQTIGEFNLTLGREARITKCL
jgi:hypothetical protein